MRTTAWIATVVVAAAATVQAGTFVPAPLAPEVGVTVLNRSEAERLVGRTLLDEPAASAVYGDVHLYSVFPYVQARYVHVTSDAGWKRLLYGTPGDAPRAYAGTLVNRAAWRRARRRLSSPIAPSTHHRLALGAGRRRSGVGSSR
jgi:hypothetical protein